MPRDVPFDSPFDDDDRRRWIDAATKALLADPVFKRLVLAELEALATGTRITVERVRS
jgi:hypothetical protein